MTTPIFEDFAFGAGWVWTAGTPKPPYGAAGWLGVVPHCPCAVFAVAPHWLWGVDEPAAAQADGCATGAAGVDGLAAAQADGCATGAAGVGGLAAAQADGCATGAAGVAGTAAAQADGCATGAAGVGALR